MMEEFIKIRGAKEHNLKNIDIDIPKNQLVVITGLSGSGKSSLAFDTIYAEGQRRYVESLSFYARQFLHLQNKPNVESISGLSPSIAIDQKTTSKNPRSTVGTLTEIYDYMRLLYARIGVPYSPYTGLPIESQSISQMVDIIMQMPSKTQIRVLAPVVRKKKGEFRKEASFLKKIGYSKLIVNKKEINIENFPHLNKTNTHNIEVIVDRLELSEDLENNRLAESLEAAIKLTQDIVYIDIIGLAPCHNSSYKENQRIVLSTKFACPESGFQLEKIEPRLFSFNSPFGACSKCEGIGYELFFDQNLIINPELSIRNGAILPWGNPIFKGFLNILESIASHYKFSLDLKFKDLPKDIVEILLYGSKEEKIEFKISNNRKTHEVFLGIIGNLHSRLKNKESTAQEHHKRDEMHKFMSKRSCSLCNGFRLKKEPLCVKIAGLNIGELALKKITEIFQWFQEIENQLSKKQKKIGEAVIKEIKSRLNFLINVGLDYLNLSREASTLSGGESQRIRLASQIGSGLSGVLYVLDEPSIGLHQRDNAKLISTLVKLRNLGNTVIIVEHDEETMRNSDHLIDIGPQAGVHGGEVMFQGHINEIDQIKNTNSITLQYLKHEKTIEIPSKARPLKKNQKKIILKGANSNNLKNIDLSISLGHFYAITGVSGSGKSTLIMHTLYNAIVKSLNSQSRVFVGNYQSLEGLKYIDKIIDIDQSPIGRTPRSNPATYTGAFGHIRDWFVELPESKLRGYKVGRFSFNVVGGRCESCQGDGIIKIEMHFLPDVYINCESCNGQRYNKETLEIKYKDKNIADILNMTVDESVEFFINIPLIYQKLITLQEVGLGYIKIGQSATTLSGGEAQRIKLAKELAKKSTGKTIYILDEPTTGLHIHDVKNLLHILHKLVDKGNTVIVIEHNLDVIKNADYIVDIGPEGGDLGGKIVTQGNLKTILSSEKSYTAKYLKNFIQNN
ncbi:MAG: excinuclease ABC subunit UvrA [Rickettsia sp.]|nr:excinuclease ABC subunit UvrA [Rickettsia sp.]